MNPRFTGTKSNERCESMKSAHTFTGSGTGWQRSAGNSINRPWP